MSDPKPLARFEYTPGKLEEAIFFLKRTRDELRELRMVRVWTDQLTLYDVNLDTFVIHGIGYQDADIVPLLNAIGAAYNRESIHEPAAQEYKEFKTGRRYPWAHDRVM